MTTANKAVLKFALGGIVTKCEEDAHAVRRQAVREELDYLIPQCDAVIAQYKAAGRAAITKAGAA